MHQLQGGFRGLFDPEITLAVGLDIHVTGDQELAAGLGLLIQPNRFLEGVGIESFLHYVFVGGKFLDISCSGIGGGPGCGSAEMRLMSYFGGGACGPAFCAWAGRIGDSNRPAITAALKIRDFVRPDTLSESPRCWMRR